MVTIRRAHAGPDSRATAAAVPRTKPGTMETSVIQAVCWIPTQMSGMYSRKNEKSNS